MEQDPLIQELISHFQLAPLPREGGWFRETYRSAYQVELEHLPPGYPAPRSFGTAIYYLLTPDCFSALHLLPGDEIYHFYSGDPVELLLLSPDGTSEIVTLGSDFRTMKPQHVVRGGLWQGSRLKSGGRYALMGTTMAPGFDFNDFVPSSKLDISKYSDHLELMKALM